MSVHDTQNPESREDALQSAVDAVRDGTLIVLPTDTVYGIGADAFSPDAVEALLEAKGRGRDTPPPVLVGDPAVLLALAVDVPDYVEDLTEAFWPGPLTLILQAQPSLTWDLGETRGTVALRMPDHEIALELLRRTGPLAVSSANRHGKPAALTVLEAATQLGDAVAEYLDAGDAPLGTSSTIIDTTVEPPEIVRAGALTQERIVEAVGDIFTAPEPEQPESPEDEQSESAEPSPADETPVGADDAETSAGSADAEPAGGSEAADGTDSAGGGEATAEAGADDAQSVAGTAGAPAAEQSTAGGEAGSPVGVLNLPSEPELEDLADGTSPAETPLDTSAPAAEPDGPPGEAPGGTATTTETPLQDPAPAESGRPEHGPG